MVNTLLLSIFAEKADLIAPSFHCVVAKDLVELITVMCAIKAVCLSLRFNGHFPGEPALAGVW